MTLSDLSDLCAIISLVISGFTAYKVVRISQSISFNGNKNKGMNQTIRGSNNTQMGKQ